MKKLKWFWSGEEEETVTLADEFADDYGWDRKWTDDKKQKGFDWEEQTKSTTKWKGYAQYRPATLSYSYVEQMANAIASQHDVRVEVGTTWSINLETKTLTYNPMNLMFGTRGALLATLLHEVGKIRLCTQYKDLKSPWLKEYKIKAYEVANVFDDFRVDSIMIDAYPSAPEIYQSQGDVIAHVITAYMQRANEVREDVASNLASIHQLVVQNTTTIGHARFADVYMKITANKTCPYKDLNEFSTAIQKEMVKVMQQPNVNDYLAVTVSRGYGLNDTPKFHKEAVVYYEATKHGIFESVKLDSTQEVLDMMDVEVYPHIKKLLEHDKKGSEEMQSVIGEGKSEEIMKAANDIEAVGMSKGDGSNPQPASRFDGRSVDGDIPDSWTEGNYPELRDSVRSEISSLYRRLLNIRKKENVVRFEAHQRRGKLNTKVLYKHATGSQRLFKKKQANTDTISMFAFSILVDSSGSMAGEKMIHTIRSLIMLSEVFDKLGMPFEIIFFESNASTVKKFGEEYSKEIKQKIANYVERNGGGTNLDSALKITNITKQQQLNKVLVVLTDGEVGDPASLDKQYFHQLMDKGVKVIPIGLQCDKEHIEKLAFGTGKHVELPAEMPKVFYEMLKSLVNKAHKK